jgi:hypothetical protein
MNPSELSESLNIVSPYLAASNLEAALPRASFVPWTGKLHFDTQVVVIICIFSNHLQWLSLHLYQLSALAISKNTLNLQLL